MQPNGCGAASLSMDVHTEPKRCASLVEVSGDGADRGDPAPVKKQKWRRLERPIC